MIESHEIVSFPIYVWQHAPKLITYKELECLGHFQAVQHNGKKSWQTVADRMETDKGSVTRILNKLVEKGLVTVKGYSVSMLPLYEKCLGLAGEYKVSEIVDTKKKKSGKNVQLAYKIIGEKLTTHKNAFAFGNGELQTLKMQKYTDEEIYEAYKRHQELSVFPLANKPHEWVSHLLLLKDYDFSDLKGCISYALNWKEENKKEGVVYLSTLSKSNLNKWITNGRQAKFEKKGHSL